MPRELTDPLTIRLQPEELSSLAIELLQGATFETARPLVRALLNVEDGGGVTLLAQEWNEVLVILRNGRYAVVAPIINKIMIQANTPEMPPAATGNGMDLEPVQEPIALDLPDPPARGRRHTRNA